MTRLPELMLAARSWVGVPFLHQGRSRYGVDCFGFVGAMLAELGIKVQSPTNYPRSPQSLLERELRRQWEEVLSPTPGAVALIKFPNVPFPSHVGLLTENGNLIHAYEAQGRVVEHGFRTPWPQRAVAYFHIPEVSYV